MNLAPQLPDRWTENADWLLQAIDPHARLARLVRMDQSSYRDASFLDDRFLSPSLETRLCDLDQLIRASVTISGPPAGWIFHIGHVGSTLVSRLLGELDGVLALREPRSLRDLTVADRDERKLLAHALSRLMARRGPGDRSVIVKATSFVSDFAPLLAEPGSAALFLYASPENYVAGILAGENSLMELEALHAIRAERLGSRGIGLSGFDASSAHRAAAAWACEMTALEAAAEAMTDRRILWADFDEMLGDMVGWLEQCADHFELGASRSRLDELVAGPLMQRYSKAMEYGYSPSLRAGLLSEAKQRYQAEMRASLAALDEAARDAPLLGRALNRVRGEH